MKFRFILFICLTSTALRAGTVVITSVSDEAHGLQPLTALSGTPLAVGTQVRVGAFPGLSDDQVLDLAAQGLPQLTAAFVSFGSSCSVGEGVDGAAGGFEIAVKDSGTAPAWAGQTVSLLIQTADGEFIVARFPGKIFEVETATGLEPLLSLHLADAKVIVGNRQGSEKLATAVAPSVGSFGTWLAGFPSITDPALKFSNADADSDGRSNFLEYATGGNPASPSDPPPCWIASDPSGNLWVRFSRVPGLGAIDYRLESSGDLLTPWVETTGTVEPDPESAGTMRMQLPTPVSASGFFRLNVESAP
ncbi:MAG: hypothetical protein ABIT37_21945 [Luteolibacter sp.]